MSYKHSRAAGGHLVHARQYGNYTALCGFTPGVNERPRLMQSRSGWRDTHVAVTCRKCQEAAK